MKRPLATKRKMRRRPSGRTRESGGRDEADRFLLWLTELGDLHLAERARTQL